MSTTLFPILPAEIAAEKIELPLCRDIKLDADGRPVVVGGSFVEVTGAEAVASWAYGALATVRYRHEIYSTGYGSELETLIGQSFSEELKTAEAPRMIREALMINPYIRAVKNINVGYSGDQLICSATLETVYGEVSIHAGQSDV